jgi:RNA polymerase sigma-70 factor (ECF subfamily)
MSPDARTSAETDRELVLRARAGDGNAVAELFTRFWRAARATAYGALRNVPAAEDAAAEAFRLALPGLNRLRDPERFGPWLRRIVRRVAARQAASVAARGQPHEEELAAAAPDPGVALERREMAMLVSAAVERLPAAEREAIALYYFEGYDTERAARFLGIPVGSLRRRLHDGRGRLRKHLNELLDGRDRRPPPASPLQARVRALVSTDAPESEWYAVMRGILLSRPVPYQLLASLFREINFADADAGMVDGLLTRPHGSLLDDQSPRGEAARAIRDALSDFDEWVVDTRAALAAFALRIRQDVPDTASTASDALVPPGLSAGLPGRYVRISRGLLFGQDDATSDLAGVLLRSETLNAFRRGAGAAWLSDVFDVYWAERRPMELSDVDAWLVDLATRVAPAAQARCSAQSAPRYRTGLRLSFDGDPRPAAIGGVLAPWPGAPADLHVVHVRLYVEPWAQVRSGTRVEADRLRVHRPGAS